jgi:hypothetical protein
MNLASKTHTESALRTTVPGDSDLDEILEEEGAEDIDELTDATDRVKCSECGGRGIVHGRKCETCEGSGFVSRLETGSYGNSGGKDSDYRHPFSHATYDREFSAEQRKKAAEKGHAMKGGGFPINTKEDLANARHALGRAKNRAATIRHIKKRARALGVELPKNWPNDAETVVEWLPIADTVMQFSNTGSSLMLYDAVELDDEAKVRYTADGYLVAQPRIARTGIQVYRGSECMRDDVDVVRVYRPAEEVFNNDYLHSLTHRPVTLDHPPEPLKADNWKKYAVGHTGDEVLRDGNMIRVPMVLMDSNAIAAYENGTKQLSVGYDCDLDWSPGTLEDGGAYDAVQRNIRANHLAVVAAARGGADLSIGDNQPTTDDDGNGKELPMNTFRTLTVDGFQVQLSERDAEIVKRTIDSLQDQLRDAKKREAEAEEEEEEEEEEKEKKDAALKDAARHLRLKDEESKAKDGVLATKDGEIAMLKKQLQDAAMTPQRLNEMVIERLGVVQKAKGILGDKYDVGIKTNDEIRKDVVLNRLGDEAKGYSDDEIRGAFKMASVVRAHDAVPSRASFDDMIKAFDGQGPISGRPGFGGYQRINPVDAAYQKYDQDVQNAWRGDQKSS